MTIIVLMKKLSLNVQARNRCYVKEGKYGCRNCNLIVKGFHEKCPRYGQEMMRVGYVARPPRKGASKKERDAFWNKYAGVNCDR